MALCATSACSRHWNRCFLYRIIVARCSVWPQAKYSKDRSRFYRSWQPLSALLVVDVCSCALYRQRRGTFTPDHRAIFLYRCRRTVAWLGYLTGQSFYGIIPGTRRRVTTPGRGAQNSAAAFHVSPLMVGVLYSNTPVNEQ